MRALVTKYSGELGGMVAIASGRVAATIQGPESAGEVNQTPLRTA